MQIYAKRILSIFLLVGVLYTFSPTQAHAQTSLPFGGLVTFTIPCTCSLSLSIGFAPLWLGSTPSVGLLTYVPGATLLHQGYLIGVPSAWHLGQYTPAVQACFVLTPVGCVPIPNVGTISRTGTSVPGR
jgi:hypothetical protein